MLEIGKMIILGNLTIHGQLDFFLNFRIKQSIFRESDIVYIKILVRKQPLMVPFKHVRIRRRHVNTARTESDH